MFVAVKIGEQAGNLSLVSTPTEEYGNMTPEYIALYRFSIWLTANFSNYSL